MQLVEDAAWKVGKIVLLIGDITFVLAISLALINYL